MLERAGGRRGGACEEDWEGMEGGGGEGERLGVRLRLGLGVDCLEAKTSRTGAMNRRDGPPRRVGARGLQRRAVHGQE